MAKSKKLTAKAKKANPPRPPSPRPKASGAKPKAGQRGTKRTPAQVAANGNGDAQGSQPVVDLRMSPPNSGVTVRMYRTGLGDCFLLCFPRKKPKGSKAAAPRPVFVLIDCGVFKGTKGGPDRVSRIAEHIYRATNDKPDGSGKSRLDLLVITHEHWDHVSGFHESQAQQVFDKFEVGQVWLPWTEDPSKPLSLRLRHMKTTTAKALRMAYKEMVDRGAGSDGPALPVKSALNMLGFGDDAGEVLAQAPDGFDRTDGAGEALKWIKDRFKDVVHFREPGPSPTDDGTLPGLDGVRFYVLGPPADEDLIRRLKPRERDDEAYSKTKAMAAAMASVFFAAFGAMPGEQALGESGTGDDEARLAEARRRRSRPFEDFYRIEAGSEKSNPDSHFKSTYFDPAQEWRKIDTDWLAAAGQFALNVDGLANNSSLVLAIELSPGGRVLLFPGDAQIGNWLSWFGKVAYPGGQDRGREMVWELDDGRRVDARDLLARTVLYKVGHHGSHNATLKKGGLEIMGARWPEEFTAMLPVDENLARNHTTYGEMPLTSIVKELLNRTNRRLLRTDYGEPPELPGKHPRLKPTLPSIDGVSPIPPDQMPGCTVDPSGDELYFDYSILDAD
jgi:hypothetical protein